MLKKESVEKVNSWTALTKFDDKEITNYLYNKMCFFYEKSKKKWNYLSMAIKLKSLILSEEMK